jgi:hypothetical protein
MSNSLGMYDWKSVVSKGKCDEVVIADYFSKQIGEKVNSDDKPMYCAL